MAYSVSLAKHGSLYVVNGYFPECMEVYPDKTPWIVPEIRRCVRETSFHPHIYPSSVGNMIFCFLSHENT